MKINTRSLRLTIIAGIAIFTVLYIISRAFWMIPVIIVVSGVVYILQATRDT
jgi:hypothetical protein